MCEHKCVSAETDSLRSHISNNELCGHWRGTLLAGWRYCNFILKDLVKLYKPFDGALTDLSILFLNCFQCMIQYRKYWGLYPPNKLEVIMFALIVKIIKKHLSQYFSDWPFRCSHFPCCLKSCPQCEINCCEVVMPNIKILFSNQIYTVLKIRAVPSQGENNL